MKIPKKKIKFEQRMFSNLLLLIFTIVLPFAMELVNWLVTKVHQLNLVQFNLSSWRTHLFWTTGTIIAISSMYLLVQLLFELKQRKWHIGTLWLSIMCTFQMWHALIRQSDGLGESKKKLSSYNRSARKVAVYTDELMAIYALPIPWDNQAHELIDNEKSIIRDKLNLMLGDRYVFSAFEEKDGYLWLRGTRRQ